MRCFILSPVVFVLSSCRGEAAGDSVRSEVLVEIGDSALYADDVLRRIPPGLAPSDSAELFASAVDRWIEDMLLWQTALDNLSDPLAIERKVEAYRRQLIVGEYMARMRQSGQRKVSESDVRGYYSRHSQEMLLERPIVKGVLLKVSYDSPQLERLRQWMARESAGSIDNIERQGMREVLQYDYFEDRWVDWQTVAQQIPYRFFDADAFLESTSDFETEFDGSVYILHISSYLPTGSVMPYDFAREQITEALGRQNSHEAERRLVRDIVNKAIDNGQLRVVGYDPVRHVRIAPQP